MGPVPALIAHGGLPGAIVEAAVAVAVAGVLIAVWVRERRARREAREPGRSEQPADDEPA